MSGDHGDVFLHRCSDPVTDGINRGSGRRLACRTIDVHCHLFVPEVQAIVAGTVGARASYAELESTFGQRSLAINAAQLQVIGPKLTTLEARLADMDRMGVDVQVVSVSPTQFFYSIEDRDVAANAAAVTNDRIAETCSKAPDRIAGLGTVSLQFPDLAAEQLEHAMCVLGFKGVEISTHANGVNLSDRRFDPFWEKANTLGAAVFIHPWGSTIGNRLDRHYLGNTVGQPMETAVALSNLIFDGTLDRHPGVKIIAAHGGGYLPTYISRSDHAFAVRPEACSCRHKPSAYLKRIWFDSLVYDPDHLERLIAAVGSSQVVLGTDYPFDMGHYDPAGILERFDPDTRIAVAGGNAAAVLGLERVEPEVL